MLGLPVSPLVAKLVHTVVSAIIAFVAHKYFAHEPAALGALDSVAGLLLGKVFLLAPEQSAVPVAAPHDTDTWPPQA